MQKIPKILQTRSDFDLALALARSGAESKSVTCNHFAGLIESAHHYAFDRVLLAAELADGAMPTFCVTDASEHDPVRRQLKQVIDPDARLFALGFTLPEVQAIITELGAK